MKLYYCSKTTEEAHAILCDGFINDSKYKGICGIYLVDAPAAKPGEQLLEISLPAEIDISPFEIFAPGAPRREWCVPVGIINQYGKTRQVSDDERDQAQFERIIEVRNELVAEGFFEQAKDSQGQLIYRDGKPVWRITEKGKAFLKRLWMLGPGSAQPGGK
jgi:hypothetical protein